MKTFKTIEIVRYPRPEVWSVMQNFLPQIARHTEGIDSVCLESREEVSADRVRVVNVWKADLAALPALAVPIPARMLEWTDYADWDRGTFECRWHIKTHFAPDHITCSGVTSYAEAMAGRGTRVTITGELGVSGAMPALGGALAGGIVGAAVETVALTVVPARFRKIVQAAAKFLQAGHAG